MSQKPKPKPDDDAQSRRFIEMAREVAADEDPKVFERTFKAVISRSTEQKETDKK
jgi:hypothetical protein